MSAGHPHSHGAVPRHQPHCEGGGPMNPELTKMYERTALFPAVPKKIVIDDHALVEVFRRSASFQKILCYLQGCAESVFSTPFSQTKRAVIVQALCAQREKQEHGESRKPVALKAGGEADAFSPVVCFFLTDLFPFLNKLVDDIPLEDMAQQRFGNRAKREFHIQMEASIVEWMRRLVDTLPDRSPASEPIQPYSYNVTDNSVRTEATGQPAATTTTGTRTEAEKQQLAVELAEYVKDAFGNATRLDLGTGHELHFFCVIVICLEEMGDVGGTLLASPAEQAQSNFVPLAVPRRPPVPVEAVASTKALRRMMVFYVFQEYLNFARRLQKHYSLEPAGSHGVWGLDDFHHIPYIFGAAQLINAEFPGGNAAAVQVPAAPPAPSSSSGAGAGVPATTTTTMMPTSATVAGAGFDVVLTKHVCDKAKVRQFSDDYMYFQMIQWILDNKSGPFHEHSNMLYNISAVEHWAKTYGGMIKMYAAEVLSKFNVIQHLLFAVHLPWNTQTLDAKPTNTEAVPESSTATA